MRQIKGYEGFYKINRQGIIINCKTGKVKKPSLGNHGYMTVDLFKNGNRETKLVHRLVAETFIPNPKNKRTVNHKNGIKTDNEADNLEWLTYSENHKHSYDNLNRTAYMEGRFGKKNHNSKPVVMMDLDGNKVNEFDSIMCAERETGILNNSICACLKGRSNTAGKHKWRYKNES